ncbi:LysR family transcriptional regulator [Boseongicola sp. H5]|uniref:LysR family transcriptional regulator n=1 Tax=Boseongicola sp. H5 TaxID=2763261 RepID=UPI001D0B8233|nr:LysR family transcriptional regulator [Boseongicola sp. H5]
MTNWDDLRIFLSVARGQSLTAAGKSLRMDPATVGRRIARLESRLGADLFLKSPQGYGLSEAGARLMPAAEEAEAALSAGVGDLTGGGETLSGSIRIGAPDGCANYLLPQVCAAICDLNPGLEVQILALPRVVDLSRREADLAIAVSRPRTARLRSEKLSAYRLSLAASDAWLARNGAPQSRADLQGARMIGYIPDMIFDAELDYLAELGLSHVPLTSNSVSVQLNWARAGAGLAVVHDFALPAAPGLRRVLPGQIALHRNFWLIRHAQALRERRLQRFAGLLADGIRAEIIRLETAVTRAETGAAQNTSS